MTQILRFALLCALIGMVSIPSLNAASPSIYPDPAEFSCNLPAPNNLQVTNTTTNSVSVSWDAVSGASGYWIVATNTQTGQTYYTNTTGNTYDTPVGLPSATWITVSVQPICNGGQVSANASLVQVLTEYVVIDDLVVQFPTPVNEIECGDPITSPSCLAVHHTGTYEYFRIYFDSNGVPVVAHANAEPSNGNYYSPGWYFGNRYNDIPTNGNSYLSRGLVSITKIENTTNNLPDLPHFTFTLCKTGNGLTICHSSEDYSIWQMECPKQVGKSPVTTGVSDLSAAFFRASPSPFTEELRVELDADAIKSTSFIQLMDAGGRVVRNLHVGADNAVLNIETGDLPSGLYLLRCQSANKAQTVKLVKAD